MATLDNSVRIEPGNSSDLDSVMAVMETAFGTLRRPRSWSRVPSDSPST